MYTVLPLSSAARQVFTIDLAPDGVPLHLSDGFAFIGFKHRGGE